MCNAWSIAKLGDARGVFGRGGRGRIRTHGEFNPTLDFESSALNRTQPPFQVSCIVDVNLRRAIIRRGAEFAKPKHHASLEYELENRVP